MRVLTEAQYRRALWDAFLAGFETSTDTFNAEYGFETDQFRHDFWAYWTGQRPPGVPPKTKDPRLSQKYEDKRARLRAAGWFDDPTTGDGPAPGEGGGDG